MKEACKKRPSLWVAQEAFTKQQERILMETGGVYWRGVKSEPLSLEDAKKVTMEAFISIFEVGICLSNSLFHCVRLGRLQNH